MKKECIFCNISIGKIESKKIFEGKNFFVIEDISPVSPGHCLIISKEHYETILEAPKEIGEELIDIIKKQSKRLIKEEFADGIKIVQNNFKSAGQKVNHLHFRVIPEKEGILRERKV